MRLDIFTLFPGHFDWFREQRHVANALAAGNELRLIDYRETTPLNARKVDDSPYGGGAGMVLRVDVVDAALQAAYGDDRSGVRILALTAQGRRFDEDRVAELSGIDHVALLCGRYEGFDQRVLDHLCDGEISIGRFVVAGGELPAMVVADAVLRRLPGALGDESSAVEESFSEALGGAPEYPHYTRPPSYRGWEVPEILLSGDHGRVRDWRHAESRRRSAPDG